MKILLAVLASSIAAVGAVLAMAEFWAMPRDVFAHDILVGTAICAGFAGVPLTALHLLRRKKKSDPYLVYAAVGALSLCFFAITRPLFFAFHETLDLWVPNLARFAMAGCIAGLVYRLTLSFRQKRA